MRLLIYSHFFAPSIGGVETIVRSLACGVAELRDAQGGAEFQITLVTQTPAGSFDDRALPFPVVRQPGMLQLWRLIRSSDIVHVAGPALSPLVLGQIANRPVVIEHHGFQTICPNGQLVIEPRCEPCPGHFMAQRYSECLRCNATQSLFASWKLWLLTFARRFLSAQAAANITPTRWLGSLLELPRVTAIAHGLNAGQAMSHAPVSSLPVIAFMGRLVSAKGVQLFLKAAKMVRDQGRSMELLVIGDGPERAALQGLAQSLGFAESVRFAGRLAGSQLEGALALVASVVVPSLGGEVFGLVVAENMARGLPVIASDLGAFAEVLDGAGLTFRAGNAAELAQAMRKILDEPGLAASLGESGRRRVLQSFSFGGMIDAHARLYRQVLENNRQ